MTLNPEPNQKSVAPARSGNRPPISLDNIRARLLQLDRIPSVPAILMPLMRYLELPIAEINVQKIVDLISHDKSVAAQCLHMANSPLFGRWTNIDSIHAAVVALGVARVRDIATSCCILRLLPQDQTCIDPRTFWEHSLGVALVSRRLARRIGFRDPEKAYLAGLLHDVGIIVNLLLLPDRFRETVAHAFELRLGYDRAEKDVMGTTHCVTGTLLAEHWRLGADVSEVIRRHHDFESASLYPGLVALTHVSDLICRTAGLGYGFNEVDGPDTAGTPAWAVLAAECPTVRTFGAAQFASEMTLYVNEVRRLVGVLFRLDPLR